MSGGTCGRFVLCTALALLVLALPATAARTDRPVLSNVSSLAYQEANDIEVDATIGPSSSAVTYRLQWGTDPLHLTTSKDYGFGASTSPTALRLLFGGEQDRVNYWRLTAV